MKKYTDEALAKGTEIEMEHAETIHKYMKDGTDVKEVARSIAKDHLEESPTYYDKLEEMESKFAKGGLLSHENARLFYTINNDYVGMIQGGVYEQDIVGSESTSTYSGVFLRMSDAFEEFFDYIKSENGQFIIKENPKSKFIIKQIYFDGISFDKYGDAVLKEKVLFSLPANQISESVSLNRFEKGGQIPTHDFKNLEGWYTEEADLKIYKTAKDYFEKNVTDDYWHFSTLYMSPTEVTYEIYSEKGGYYIYIKHDGGKNISKPILKKMDETMAKGGGVRRYNLPINDSYKLIDSFYTGGLDNGIACDNCGRPISNVATIKNTKGETFNVGLDCAETLTNLDGLDSAIMDFEELKSIQAKIRKLEKEGKKLSYEINVNGDLSIKNDDYNVLTKDIGFASKYMKKYLSEVVNPEKIGFHYTDKNVKIPFERFKPSENLNFEKKWNIDEYQITVTVKPYYHLVTKEISGYDLYLEIDTNEENIFSGRVTMYNGLERDINYAIKRYLFDKYNNPNMTFAVGGDTYDSEKENMSIEDKLAETNKKREDDYAKQPMVKVLAEYMEEQLYESEKEVFITASEFKKYQKTGEVPTWLRHEMTSFTGLEHWIKTTPLTLHLTKVDDSFSDGGQTDAQQKKIATVMREFKEGELTSHGKEVTNPKQAIAIALSEAGVERKEQGGDIRSVKYNEGDIKLLLEEHYYGNDTDTELVPVSELVKMREFDRTVTPKWNAEESNRNIKFLKQKFIEEGIKEPLMIEYSNEQKAVLLTEGNHRVNIALDLGIDYLPARIVVNKYTKFKGNQAKKMLPVSGYAPKEDGYIPSALRPSQVGIQGIKPLRYEEGGIIEGQLHSECNEDHGCGRKFQVGEGGRIIEAERDEAVIVSKAFEDENEYTIKGTPSEIASAINVLGDGKSFDAGAEIKTADGQPIEIPELEIEAPDTDVEDVIESGSVIINRKSMADETEYEVTGTPKQIASAINSIDGNGVVIEEGAEIEKTED